MNSALQRARATLEQVELTPETTAGEADPELLERYVRAFEDYDLDALTELIHEDATQSMPPFDLWLSGRDYIFTWWFGPGIGCKGSRVVPAGSAPVLVACSGGADSLALLAAAVFEARDQPWPVVGVTVDHGLREDSA